jgi:hypothetical protein
MKGEPKMKFYIDTIEQIIGEEEGTYTEYGLREKVNDENLALSKYYTKLSNVAADLGKGHVYMDIKISNSIGGIVKRDTLGEYIDQ